MYVWKEHAPNHWGVIFTYSAHEGVISSHIWPLTWTSAVIFIGLIYSIPLHHIRFSQFNCVGTK